MVKKIVLQNGLTVVTQRLKGYKSVSVGVWVKAGSSFESQSDNGMAHFIEHMVFKGTRNRSAAQIAIEIDAVGGEMNAFTAKECTCFYTKTLSGDLDLALDLLSDMMLNPTFDPDHIELEKTVIQDEINMYEDASEEIANDLIHEVLYGDHPLSLPVLGTKESVSKFNQVSVFDFFNRFYRANNMVLSIAGDFDPEQIESQVTRYFERIPEKLDLSLKTIPSPTQNWTYGFKQKDFEQVQVVIAFPGIPFDHKMSYNMSLLNQFLGGSNSSMLFQEVRENLGLTYSIFSEPTFYDEIGMLEISFGVSKEKMSETLSAIISVILELKSRIFTDQEIEHGKNHLKGSFVLGMEGSDQYMDFIGRIELFAHKEKNMDEMLAKIEETSLIGMKKLIEHCFSTGNFAMAFVGDVTESEVKTYYNKMKTALD